MTFWENIFFILFLKAKRKDILGSLFEAEEQFKKKTNNQTNKNQQQEIKETYGRR